MSKQVRLSNFELLRIFCMLGVLTSHSLMAMYNLHTTNFSISNELRVFFMNTSCLAVNCFIMISGYFQIRQSWKGFVGLISPCVFWTIICCGIAYCFNECTFIDLVKRVVFPLIENGLWFLTAYFALYLISPLLNTGINNLDNNQLKYSCLMLLIIDVYLGYMHQSPEITTDGYHLIHFITLYIFASTLKRIRIKLLANNMLIKLGGITILIITLMTLLHMVKMIFPPIAIIYSMRYNSPMILIASMLLFLLFANIKINSKFINYISSSVLSVYLISSLPFFGSRYYKSIIQLNESYHGIYALLLIVGTMISFYAYCILIDKLRILLTKPLECKIITFFEKITLNVRNGL